MKLFLITFLLCLSFAQAKLLEYSATITSVKDGDTLEAVIDLGFDISIKQTVRLKGLDAPELKTPQGITARDYLTERLKGKAVTLEVESTKLREKYGRLLATIILKGKNINLELIEKGLAKEYDGGKR